MATELMLIKTSSGQLLPASETDVEKLQKFKAGKELGCTIRTLRNGKFHRKCFALFGYLYEQLDRPTYMLGDVEHEQSFDGFRDTVLITCGYWTPEFVGDRVRAVADSISYEKCSQEKIERIYSDVIDYGLKVLGQDHSREGLDWIVDNLIRFS